MRDKCPLCKLKLNNLYALAVCPVCGSKFNDYFLLKIYKEIKSIKRLLRLRKEV